MSSPTQSIREPTLLSTCKYPPPLHMLGENQGATAVSYIRTLVIYIYGLVLTSMTDAIFSLRKIRPELLGESNQPSLCRTSTSGERIEILVPAEKTSSVNRTLSQ